jgi:N-methylhydantoinase B
MLDVISIQILRNKIASLVDEMHYHFYRSGFSTIIRESRDFSCVILDRTGRLIVAPPMFFHAPVYRHLVQRILALYGAAGSLREGDVFVSNHPYEGGLPHVSDMAFIAPVFSNGEVVAFSGSIAHKADVGGTMPGSTSANATEMFHEGILVPPIKIWDAGRPLADVERLILANSRQPDLVHGDMTAQISVTQLGAARTAELCERFGAPMLTASFAAILGGAAEALGAALGRLPDGQATAEGWLDSDGVVTDQPVKLAATVTIQGGRAIFDLSRSDRQTKGPVNLRPSMVEACVFYALIGSLGPELHFNDGMRDCVDIIYAPDTVTNASPPAPVSNYQMMNLKLVDVLLEAMGQLNPSRANAHGGSSSALLISWAKGRPGQSTMQYEILGSAYGAGRGHDGASCTAAHLSNLHITPIEILESEFPCRIEAFEPVADTGGAGEWRGGLAFRREYHLLEDALVVRRFDKSRFPPGGVAGGGDGGAARSVIGLGTESEREIRQSGRVEMKAGERFMIQTAGGGGYGAPAQRDEAALRQDVAEGYVTPAAAREIYHNEPLV